MTETEWLAERIYIADVQKMIEFVFRTMSPRKRCLYLSACLWTELTDSEHSDLLREIPVHLEEYADRPERHARIRSSFENWLGDAERNWHAGLRPGS